MRESSSWQESVGHGDDVVDEGGKRLCQKSSSFNIRRTVTIMLCWLCLMNVFRVQLDIVQLPSDLVSLDP